MRFINLVFGGFLKRTVCNYGCNVRLQRRRGWFPRVRYTHLMTSGKLLSQFVDPPGGHRTGVQSPKPSCKPRARQEHARSNPGAGQEQPGAGQEQARSEPD